MGFAKFRIGHAAARIKHGKTQIHQRRDPNPSCATGGFYKSPTNGATVDSASPLAIAWDTTCLQDTTSVDIYLIAPGSSRARIHLWQQVPFADGSYTAKLMPRWWNATSSESLQLSIVPYNTPPFLSTLPAGPVFTATYTAPAAGQSTPPEADTSIPDSGITQVNNGHANLGADTSSATHKSLAPGKTAAAVLLPLLIVLGALVFYIRWQRKNSKQKSKRYSEAIDKRMSVISADWKSMSAAGASAAIRASMALPDAAPRHSSYFVGGFRPMSSFVTSENQAGVGAAALPGPIDHPYAHATHQHQASLPTMTQVRAGTGVGLRPGAAALAAANKERVSRVSFAADTRPSGEFKRMTRAMAGQSAYIPPLPATNRTDVVSAASLYPEELVQVPEDAAGSMSPRQAQGALSLSPEDIKARVATAAASRSRSASNANVSEKNMQDDEEVLPALSMMRTNNQDDSPIQMPTPVHTKPPTPTSPAPPYSSPLPPPTASYTPHTPGMPSIFAYQQQQPQQQPQPSGAAQEAIPAGVMSPDAMLRAYAERRSVLAASPYPSSLITTASASSGAAPSTTGATAGSTSSTVPPQFSSPDSPFASATPIVSPYVSARPDSPGMSASGGSGKRKMSFRALGRKMSSDRLMKGSKLASSSSSSSSQEGHAKSGLVISYPMPAVTSNASSMKGVGVGAGAGATYAIGEDDEDVDYESAYVGTAQ